MVWKYQNEIAPIFYFGKSPKLPNLHPPDWGQSCWMTRYTKIIKYKKENEVAAIKGVT